MYQEEKSVLAERMTELRKRHNLTQEDIAKYLNCNRATVANYENGKRQPDYNTLIKLAKKHGVSTDYLLGFTDVTTTDRDLKFICDYTGLSEKSVKLLRYVKENYKNENKYDGRQKSINEVLDIANALLEHSPFGLDEIALLTAEYKNALIQEAKNIEATIENSNNELQYLDALCELSLNGKQIEYKCYDIQEAFKDFIKSYAKDEIDQYQKMRENMFNAIETYAKIKKEEKAGEP